MQPRLARATRFGLLGGLTAGLGLSPHLPIEPPGPDAIAGALAGVAALAFSARTIRTDGMRVAWLAAVALLAAAVGLALGSARVRAIERGAYAGDAGKALAVRGFVAAVPRRAEGEVRARIDTADGRLALEAREPVGELPVGREVVARGVVREPEAWEASYLERLGIARVVEVRHVRLTSRRRGGIAYPIDRVRERAQAALGRGTSESAASLLRGFVLGEDDRIDPATVEDFQRSGLAHLL